MGPKRRLWVPGPDLRPDCVRFFGVRKRCVQWSEVFFCFFFFSGTDPPPLAGDLVPMNQSVRPQPEAASPDRRRARAADVGAVVSRRERITIICRQHETAALVWMWLSATAVCKPAIMT